MAKAVIFGGSLFYCVSVILSNAAPLNVCLGWPRVHYVTLARRRVKLLSSAPPPPLSPRYNRDDGGKKPFLRLMCVRTLHVLAANRRGSAISILSFPAGAGGGFEFSFLPFDLIYDPLN